MIFKRGELRYMSGRSGAPSESELARLIEGVLQ
jgi:hypothetical protein